MDDENKSKQNIETFTADMVQAISNDKSGLVKKLIHEEEEKQRSKEIIFTSSRKNLFFIFSGIGLICIAIALFVFVVMFNKEKDVLSPISKNGQLFIDQTTEKDVTGLSKENISMEVLNFSINSTVKNGGLESLYIFENGMKLNFSRLMSFLKSELNIHQLSVFEPEFFIGVFKSKNPAESIAKGDLFLIFQTKSFDDAFPVLKAWEKKMLVDIGGFFGINLSPQTAYLFEKAWQDKIILNKNAKILTDDQGEIVLFYSFLNDKQMIITKSEQAMKEVILRLYSSRVKK